MNKKLKIAIFHCGFIYTGGGERIVIEEIFGLRKRGYEVGCYVPVYDEKLSYPDIIKSLKIKTLLPQFPKYFPLRYAIQMVASCLAVSFLVPRFIKYDIIIGANQPGAFLAFVVAKLLKKPYLVYLNQPNRILYKRSHEDWQNVKDYYVLDKIINIFLKPFVSFLDTRSITSGENLLINGNFVAKEISRVYKPKKWLDCPAGAKPEKNLNFKRDNGKIKVDNIVIEKPYLLYTSRHEPWKKFDWAIEITKLVNKKFPIKLVIPGAYNALTPKLIKLAKELGVEDKIIFTGAINQKLLWELYKNAAVYLFTSPKEDLGIVVEEAQACGVPVIAWNRGGPTVTVVNGKTGLLAKPYSKQDFANKVLLLLKNPEKRQKMGKEAVRHIERNLSWEIHLNILEKEIKRVLIR